MKLSIKKLVDNVKFQLVAAGLMFMAAGTLVFGVMVALALYIHPMAAPVFLLLVIIVMGHFFDISD